MRASTACRKEKPLCVLHVGFVALTYCEEETRDDETFLDRCFLFVTFLPDSGTRPVFSVSSAGCEEDFSFFYEEAGLVEKDQRGAKICTHSRNDNSGTIHFRSETSEAHTLRGRCVRIPVCDLGVRHHTRRYKCCRSRVHSSDSLFVTKCLLTN